MRSVHFPLLGLIVIALTTAPAPGFAQGIGGLRKKAEEAKKKLEDASKRPAADSARAKPAPDAGKSASTQGATSPSTAAGGPAQGTPNKTVTADAKVWANYDFVPGSRIIFFTDFSEDRVGNFARGLKYVSGPAEVVERDGAKALRSTARSTMLIPVGRKLPQRFTLEIDVLSANPGINDQIVLEGGRERSRGDKSVEVSWSPKGTFMLGSGQDAATGTVSIPEAVQSQLIGNVTHIRVLMDSGYFKMYVNERRMYNNPDLQFRRDSVIRMEVHGSEDQPVFLTSIRVAESETDVLYDALTAKGRWSTQGILFATGKANLQPESRPVLEEIASTLEQHGDLKILIEGHTDNVGAAASNMTLSDARAAAVKAALVADYGVDGGRITTKGFGDTKPSAPNTSGAGRAQNRRVEVVKP